MIKSKEHTTTSLIIATRIKFPFSIPCYVFKYNQTIKLCISPTFSQVNNSIFSQSIFLIHWGKNYVRIFAFLLIFSFYVSSFLNPSQVPFTLWFKKKYIYIYTIYFSYILGKNTTCLMVPYGS